VEIHHLEHLHHRVLCAHAFQRREVGKELDRREVVVDAKVLRQVAELRRSSSGCFTMSAPRKVIRPVLGRVTVAIICMSVVLPAPFGPSKPITPESAQRDIAHAEVPRAELLRDLLNLQHSRCSRQERCGGRRLRYRARHRRVVSRAAARPSGQSQLLEEPQARGVMTHDQADERGDFQPRAFGDRAREERPSDAAASEAFVNVDAELRRAAIRATGDERMEAQPPRDSIVEFRNPEWMAIRRVLVEPRDALFHGNRLEHCGREPRRDGGVEDVDDRREIRFDASRIVMPPGPRPLARAAREEEIVERRLNGPGRVSPMR
jgi:hypothetical protein